MKKARNVNAKNCLTVPDYVNMLVYWVTGTPVEVRGGTGNTGRNRPISNRGGKSKGTKRDLKQDNCSSRLGKEGDATQKKPRESHGKGIKKKIEETSNHTLNESKKKRAP